MTISVRECDPSWGIFSHLHTQALQTRKLSKNTASRVRVTNHYSVLVKGLVGKTQELTNCNRCRTGENLLVNGSHATLAPSPQHTQWSHRAFVSSGLTGLAAAVDLWFIHLKVILLDSPILISLNAIFDKSDGFSGG